MGTLKCFLFSFKIAFWIFIILNFLIPQHYALFVGFFTLVITFGLFLFSQEKSIKSDKIQESDLVRCIGCGQKILQIKGTAPECKKCGEKSISNPLLFGNYSKDF